METYGTSGTEQQGEGDGGRLWERDKTKRGMSMGDD